MSSCCAACMCFGSGVVDACNCASCTTLEEKWPADHRVPPPVRYDLYDRLSAYRPYSLLFKFALLQDLQTPTTQTDYQSSCPHHSGAAPKPPTTKEPASGLPLERQTTMGIVGLKHAYGCRHQPSPYAILPLKNNK
jgi:hypothetical protein